MEKVPRQMLYTKASNKMCRRSGILAEAINLVPARRPKCRRRVQNISPTRPRISPTRLKYFADASIIFRDASKDFADASRYFTAEVVTLPTRPVTGGGFVDGDVVKSIIIRGIEEERRFASRKEEADIRMLMHAGFADADFAARGVHGTVVIRSPDTDVLVLAVNYFPKMANTVKMWLETGTITSTTDKRRFVPVHSICAAVGPQFCNMFSAVHSLTRCDSVSSLFGIGKKIVFSVVIQKGVDHFEAPYYPRHRQ